MNGLWDVEIDTFYLSKIHQISGLKLRIHETKIK